MNVETCHIVILPLFIVQHISLIDSIIDIYSTFIRIITEDIKK